MVVFIDFQVSDFFANPDLHPWLLQLHNKRVHGKIAGRTVLGEVHPVGAPNKTLISDTA